MSDTENNPLEFDFKYFCTQLCEFREHMGNKSFWDNEVKKDTAVKALTLCYFNTKTESDEEKLQVRFAYEAAIHEFNLRENMLFRLKIESMMEEIHG